MSEKAKSTILQQLLPGGDVNQTMPPATTSQTQNLRPQLEERIAAIKENARGRSFEARFQEIGDNMARNRALMEEHRATLDTAWQNKKEKDQREKLEHQELHRKFAEQQALGSARNTWVSWNAEAAQKHLAYSNTRWNEVFRETRGDPWAMTTSHWHSQSQGRPATVNVHDSSGAPLTVRLWPPEKLNPFF